MARRIRVELPTELVALLRAAVTALAGGQAVTIPTTQTVPTTEAAAEILGVSRPTLVHLLEAGQIPNTQPNRHRRVALADLLSYQQARQAERRRMLAEMSDLSADYDPLDRANTFVPTR